MRLLIKKIHRDDMWTVAIKIKEIPDAPGIIQACRRNVYA
jgi:hypothetical protein